MRSARSFALLAVVATLALASPPTAAGQDPGRWLLTGASSVPVNYFQGLTTNPSESDVYFIGVFQGLWRTDPLLGQKAGVASEIPASVTASEGYNHIGDLTWNPGEGGRLILPMECFTPGGPNGGNTCRTGAFGVADPATLAFRYYVKLDPAEIPKAMWAETSPDGSLIWTSSGNDLLAYRSSDVSAANAGPGGPVIHAVRRLVGAVPPTGITGAVFFHDRLLLAGEQNHTYQVWAVNLANGERRLEIEMHICGESEGLDVLPTLGGDLHWLISPIDPGCQLTFGPSSALLQFAERPAHERYDVTVLDVSTTGIPGTVTAIVKASRDGHPLHQARVSFAGGEGRTDNNGFATVTATLERPGRFRALAEQGQNFGVSPLVPVGLGSGA
jgi:hypothetical protein